MTLHVFTATPNPIFAGVLCWPKKSPHSGCLTGWVKTDAERATLILAATIVHQTLRVTPAMEAGLSNHVWSIEELVDLLEQGSSKQAAA